MCGVLIWKANLKIFLDTGKNVPLFVFMNALSALLKTMLMVDVLF